MNAIISQINETALRLRIAHRALLDEDSVEILEAADIFLGNAREADALGMADRASDCLQTAVNYVSGAYEMAGISERRINETETEIRMMGIRLREAASETYGIVPFEIWMDLMGGADHFMHWTETAPLTPAGLEEAEDGFDSILGMVADALEDEGYQYEGENYEPRFIALDHFATASC